MKNGKTPRLVSLLALLALVALPLLSACSAATGTEAPADQAPAVQEPATQEPATPAPMAFVDDMGRTITLDAYPERIVSTSPSLTEMLFAVGAGDKLVGRDDFSVYPEEVADVPSFGSLFSDFPAEAILAMQPDLVVAAQIISEEQVQALEDLGLTVYWQANPTSFEDLYKNINDLAGLVGKSDNASALVSDLEARVSAVQATVADAETTPVVFYELDATDPNNPWTAGGGTFIDLIINMAGGANAGAALEGDYAQMSVEALIEQDPTYIILGDSDFGGVTPEMVAARGGWDVMSAVANGEVHIFDSNLLSVPGPRLVDGLEQVARIIHPELFN